ncbi:Folylpolyglutamate synthetase, partial [Tieghemiomyces parasiticus]
SAVRDLNTLQTNATVLANQARVGFPAYGTGLANMKVHLDRLGYQPSDLNRLNVIHVAGTKGKGSTSVYCESILRRLPRGSSDEAPLRVGVYTSPHLIQARERIRLGGKPVAESLFAKYFYEVWDAVIAQRMDVVVLEVGIGGRYDSTNLVPKPVVCGITSLGLDHQSVLGNTLAEIAAQKAGIAKPGVPLISVPQPLEAREAIERVAKEEKAFLSWLIPNLAYRTIPLGIQGAHQALNAQLAAALTTHWVRGSSLRHPAVERALAELTSAGPQIPPFIAEGITEARWPGRSQVVREPESNLTWYLDGAHTKESMEACATWFTATALAEPPVPTVLIFNCSRGRASGGMLQALGRHVLPRIPITAAVFCPNLTQRSDGQNYNVNIGAELPDQHEHRAIWDALCAETGVTCTTAVAPTIQAAVDWARAQAPADRPSQGFVTGSLHLVGGVLDVLDVPLFDK